LKVLYFENAIIHPGTADLGILIHTEILINNLFLTINLNISISVWLCLQTLPTGRCSCTQLMMMENGTTLMLDEYYRYYHNERKTFKKK
jgi:hypothetical protein